MSKQRKHQYRWYPEINPTPLNEDLPFEMSLKPSSRQDQESWILPVATTSGVSVGCILITTLLPEKIIWLQEAEKKVKLIVESTRQGWFAARRRSFQTTFWLESNQRSYEDIYGNFSNLIIQSKSVTDSGGITMQDLSSWNGFPAIRDVLLTRWVNCWIAC